MTAAVTVVGAVAIVVAYGRVILRLRRFAHGAIAREEARHA